MSISFARLWAALSMIAVSVALDLSDMPRSICGWPSLHTTGLFPPYTTRVAQRLLGLALHLPIEEIVVDGVFTDTTTQQISNFQLQEGLEVNGYLNANTWPTLLSKFTPTSANSNGLAVEAIQDLLTASGVSTEINGVYDERTSAAVSSFQKSHRAEYVVGDMVDEQTWHLLITQCNSSDVSYYWFDAGWPQGSISADTFKCLSDTGFVYTTIECWREKDNGSLVTDCVSNVANAWAGGFKHVDVYMYAERFADPVSQTTSLLHQLKINNVKYGAVMIDIEGDKWNNFTTDENREFLLSIKKVLEAANKPITIYSGAAWTTYFGDGFTAFSQYPLIYAHYDNIPSFYDFASYGGWAQPAAKQFYDGIEPEVVCNLPLDWDWSPSPFWEKY